MLKEPSSSQSSSTTLLCSSALVTFSCHNLEVVKFGSNKNKGKQNHVYRDEWPKSKVESPIIKGRGFSKRGKTVKKRRNVLGDFDDKIMAEREGKRDKKVDRTMVLDDTQ